MAHRLYLDTCILNDAFPLSQHELGSNVRRKDLKIPLSRWAAEYVALYHLLDLDDQWELEFGTSEVTLEEIARFRLRGAVASEKKAFLEDVYHLLYDNFVKKCKIVSSPILPDLIQRISSLLGPGHDSSHLCHAIQGGWEFFITTDFNTILVHQFTLEQLTITAHGFQPRLWPQGELEPIVETSGIKARSPLQFLEENLLSLPALIRTLYGSWTDPDEFIARTGRALLELAKY